MKANLTKSTKSVKGKEIVRQWHLVDANKKILGRMIPEITHFLQGKHKANYISHLDSGDYVVVVNVDAVRVTGSKQSSKVYTRYSGYPGGLKKISYAKMKQEKPEEIIRHAVSGMLPKNKLRDRRMTRLFVFKGSTHTYEDKLKIKYKK
ncbi:MAG TPA: 50S ribosomal protein L13 [Patescibacteria group bacterium]|nr:50S ribosomal protein L13 [Patescibacteria group bacterium]